MVIDGQEVVILAGIAPWIIPAVAMALSAAGSTVQARQQNKNQRKMIRHQTRRRQEEHDARQRANILRHQSLMKQREFDSQRQSAISKALREGFGEGRQGRIDEAGQKNTQSQLAAIKSEAKGGRVFNTGSRTKGRVSGKLSESKKRSAKENKAYSKRRAGLRGLIGAYQRQPIADQRTSIGLNQAIQMNQQRARSAAELGAMRANIAGQVGPEEVMWLNPTSTLGSLATAAGAGLAAYGSFANMGGGTGAKTFPLPTGGTGTGGPIQGIPLPGPTGHGSWGTPWGGR